jgi:basic membrane protein A and related proteins
LAPKGWLTGARLDWGPLYVKLAKQVMDKSWKPLSYTAGMEGKEECVKLSSFGKSVPPAVQKEILAKEKSIRGGSFVVFQGPMKDLDGKERVAAGQKLDIKALSEMNWFVPGVPGALPKK